METKNNMDTDNTDRIEQQVSPDGCLEEPERLEEPLISLIKLVAEYGMDEVMDAMSMVEIYAPTASFDDVDPLIVEDTDARKGMNLSTLEDGRFGIFDEIAGNTIEVSLDRDRVLARLAELRRGRGEYLPN